MMDMRVSEDEKTSFSKFREVSELRTQFQCEYRLYLNQKLGDKITKASIEGSRLHSRFHKEYEETSGEKRLVPLAIIILTIFIGILWILG